MGSAEHVQKGYAIFVLIEVCFATLLFLGCTELIARFGLLFLFPAVSATALLAILLLVWMPDHSSARLTVGPQARGVGHALRLLALVSFGLFFRVRIPQGKI